MNCQTQNSVYRPICEAMASIIETRASLKEYFAEPEQAIEGVDCAGIGSSLKTRANLLQINPDNPPFDTDKFLVVICQLFCDRLDAYAVFADHLERTEQRGDDAEYARLLSRHNELWMEWQALGQGIAATPAVRLAGLQAKARALHIYLEYFGEPEGIAGIGCELTRSLVSDLMTARGGPPAHP